VLSESVYVVTTNGDPEMPTTTPTRTNRTWRKHWVLFYQDATGTPDDPILDATFTTDAEAMAWAEARTIVPLWLEEEEQLLDSAG
jgi:hypothetical protein